MQVDHIHIQTAQHSHCFLHRIGDIMQFQVEENLMSTTLQLTNNSRAFSIKKLHANLYKRLLFRKSIQESIRFFCARKITRYNHFSFHIFSGHAHF